MMMKGIFSVKQKNDDRKYLFYTSFFIEVQLTEEGETNMNTTEAEKDWLRRISSKEPSDTAEKQVRKVAKEAVEQKITPQKKKAMVSVMLPA